MGTRENLIKMAWSLTKEECLDKMRIGIGAKVNDDAVKRDSFLKDLEEYIFIPLNNEASIKVWRPVLAAKGIEEKEAWDAAERNTIADAKIKNLNSVLGFPEDEGAELKMFVISNSSCCRGAGAAIARNKIKEIAMEHGAKTIVLLPSSIHEMLFVLDPNPDIEKLTEMVKSINEAVVSPEDKLADAVYVYDVNDL